MVYVFLRDTDPTAPIDRGLRIRNLFVPRLDGLPVGTKAREFRISMRPDPRHWFRLIAEEMRTQSQADQVTCIVPVLDPLRLNPLMEGWESLIAMLVLAFPETSWILGTMRLNFSTAVENTEAIVKSQKRNIEELHTSCGVQWLFGLDPIQLFDGAGLRDWIRSRMRTDKKLGLKLAYLPRRGFLAIALDEERDYALLHSLAGYRFGFRAIPVCTYAMAKHLLGPEAMHEKAHNPAMVLEDIYLNFPDSGSLRLSNLEGVRRTKFPILENAEIRIFVTSGESRHDPLAQKTAAENSRYIGKQRSAGRYIEDLRKPHAGMFRLWEEAKLSRALPGLLSTAPGRDAPNDPSSDAAPGYAPGYVWPPRWQTLTRLGDADQEARSSAKDAHDAAQSLGHSADGALLAIAEELVDRAEGQLDDVHNVRDAVRGAILATDALELLGGMTPTMSFEALRLRHEFEVLAECQFSGVEHHFHVRPRLKEIRRDVGAISKWFESHRQVGAAQNAEMKILTRLVRVFREHGQFDEEQLCNNRVRQLHNTLWMHDRKRPWRLLLWPILRYLEMLLSSFAVFAAVILGWVAVLTLLYLADPPVPAIIEYGWRGGLADALSSFFAVNPPILGALSSWRAAVACAAIFSGFIHLGVFVSHLYTISSRR